MKGHPTVVDSVLVKYKGQYFNSTTELIDFDERTIQPVWFTLHSVIRGWSLGFGYFKGGENITNNGPITYINGGKEYYSYPQDWLTANLLLLVYPLAQVYFFTLNYMI